MAARYDTLLRVADDAAHYTGDRDTRDAGDRQKIMLAASLLAAVMPNAT
jgi:hypothetical protein